jgi:hypothetical protein
MGSTRVTERRGAHRPYTILTPLRAKKASMLPALCGIPDRLPPKHRLRCADCEFPGHSELPMPLANPASVINADDH